MKKDFGKHNWVYPMPVFIIGTYNEDGSANAMNAAWAGTYDTNQLFLCLSNDHKTTENIRRTKAFTVSFATSDQVVGCDYVGIVSGNKVADKFEKAGFTFTASTHVNAPVINELPMAMECSLNKFNEDGMVIGDIVNVSAEESILGENGKIDPSKAKFISYDGANNTYLILDGIAGYAFKDGMKLK